MLLHVLDSSPRAEVNAAHIDSQNAVEVLFAGARDRSDMRHASAVHQDVNSTLRKHRVERLANARGIGNIAAKRLRLSA